MYIFKRMHYSQPALKGRTDTPNRHISHPPNSLQNMFNANVLIQLTYISQCQYPINRTNIFQGPNLPDQHFPGAQFGNPCQWLPNWLTPWCLVDLIVVTLACEDANSNLLRLLLWLMLMMRIVLATVCCRFGNWGLDINTEHFCSDFEHKVWSRFWSWSSGKIWS